MLDTLITVVTAGGLLIFFGFQLALFFLLRKIERKDGLHLRLEVVQGTERAEPESAPDLSPDHSPPDEVLEFCAQESEQWAREDMLRRARRLYDELRNWDRVLTQLKMEQKIVE